MSGYTDCPCRDCFEISIDHALCSDCEAAGCEPNAETECQSPHAYGGDTEDGQ